MHLTTNPRVRPNAVKNQPGGGTQDYQANTVRDWPLEMSILLRASKQACATSLCHLGYSRAWFFGLTLPRKRPPRVVPLLAVLDVPVLDLHYGGVLALVERPAIDRIFLAALLLLQDRRPMRPVFHRVQRH